jgi:hypothetical protein
VLLGPPEGTIEGVTIKTLRALALIFVAVCLVWAAHWAVTCWGRDGSFRYRSIGTPLGIGWGHNSAMLWLHKGQRVTFRYRAAIEGECNVSYFVVAHRGFRFRPYGSMDIKGTGVGALMFTAQQDGLHSLRYVSRQPWKGRIEMSWHAPPG